MSSVVESRPVVRERLQQLAAEYDPQLAKARRAIAAASDPDARKAARREHRDLHRRYRSAPRGAKRLLGSPARW